MDIARTFIFDTGLAPPSVGSGLAALHVLRREPERVGAVRRNAVRLSELARAAGLSAVTPAGAVISVPVGAPSEALRAAATCEEHGVRVGCFRPPSVPDAVSRLRLTARCDLSDDDIERAGRALEAVAATRQRPAPGLGSVGWVCRELWPHLTWVNDVGISAGGRHRSFRRVRPACGR